MKARRIVHPVVPTFLLLAALGVAQAPPPTPPPPAPSPEAAPPPKAAATFKPVIDLARRPSLDQGNTGTCWCFATTSFFESEVERLTGKAVDLSEMHTVRWSILEKAREYVKRGGKNTFDEGGLSHDVTFVAGKYGFLPAEAYVGRAKEARMHDHSELFRALKALMKGLVGEGGRLSPQWEAAVLGVVDAYLGKPPEEVVVDGRTMTPLEYTREILGLKLADYVEVMSYSYTPMGAPGKLTVPDNWMHFDAYRNLPLDEFMHHIENSLRRGFTVAVDIDVSEPGFRSARGVAKLVPEALEAPGAVDQALRDAMFQDHRTTDDHLMHIVGLATDESGRKFYLTKDSGGPKRGPYEGHTYISENYLRAKALGFMVHKDALVPPSH